MGFCFVFRLQMYEKNNMIIAFEGEMKRPYLFLGILWLWQLMQIGFHALNEQFGIDA